MKVTLTPAQVHTFTSIVDGLVSELEHEADPALFPAAAKPPATADDFLWGRSVFNSLGRFEGLGGEMEIGTFARVEDAEGVRLVQRDMTVLRAGEARAYLPGDIHDTRCLRGPSLLFRFTERDLRTEELEQRMTRYVLHQGTWTVGQP